MPDVRVFIDSNTFLYTFDEQQPRKAAQAQHWLRYLAKLDWGVANLQVLNEVTNVIVRKSHRFAGVDPFYRVDTFASFGSTPLTNEIALTARDVFRGFRYSWWDCLLLASAIELGCTHFLSEDMQDAQAVRLPGGALTIVNPFVQTPEEILV